MRIDEISFRNSVGKFALITLKDGATVSGCVDEYSGVRVALWGRNNLYYSDIREVRIMDPRTKDFWKGRMGERWSITWRDGLDENERKHAVLNIAGPLEHLVTEGYNIPYDSIVNVVPIRSSLLPPGTKTDTNDFTTAAFWKNRGGETWHIKGISGFSGTYVIAKEGPVSSVGYLYGDSVPGSGSDVGPAGCDHPILNIRDLIIAERVDIRNDLKTEDSESECDIPLWLGQWRRGDDGVDFQSLLEGPDELGVIALRLGVREYLGEAWLDASTYISGPRTEDEERAWMLKYLLEHKPEAVDAELYLRTITKEEEPLFQKPSAPNMALRARLMGALLADHGVPLPHEEEEYECDDQF